MAIIMTPLMFEGIVERIVESAEEAEDPSTHILNFYEAFSMPLSDLYELIDAAKTGELEDVQEKMDGQNITLTVQDNRLLFFSKGGSGDGKDRAGVGGHPVESVRNAFVKAYDAIEEVAIPAADPSRWSDLFQNGAVKIESALLTPENPNTIVYDEPSIRFIGVNSDDPDVVSTFNRFVSEAEQSANENFYMGPVPYLKLKQSLEATDKEADQIRQQLGSLLSSYGIESSATVRDLAGAMVRDRLVESGLVPDSLLAPVTSRILTGKGEIGRLFPKVAGREAWQEFNSKILKHRASFLALSIVELERIIQRIGELAFKNLEFTLRASNRDDLINQVISVKNAFKNQKIITNPKVRERLRASLASISSADDPTFEEIAGRFEQATEGIVFSWKGKTRKLTGLFTPINKLRGFFAYSGATIQDDEAGIREIALRNLVRDVICEGGKAFRLRTAGGRAAGPPVTTDEPIPRSLAETIIGIVDNNILKPLMLEFEPAGSTGTDKELIGDVDLIVSEPDVNTLISKLQGLSYLSDELVEGIPRIYPLGVGSARTGAAVMIAVREGGPYYQVDLFASPDMEDTAFELSGGGEGAVRGEYHKLMLHLLARNRGLRESKPGTTYKYTLQFPGGYREKVNGELVGRVIDPDDYLPLVGIRVPKREIWTFEKLVDHMRNNIGEEGFVDALSDGEKGFRTYIDWKFNTKDEKTKNEAQKAINYIERENPTHTSETLREFIQAVIIG